jgi:calcineurin-like phosphoesterase
MEGAVITVNRETGKAEEIKRIRITENDNY